MVLLSLAPGPQQPYTFQSRHRPSPSLACDHMRRGEKQSAINFRGPRSCLYLSSPLALLRLVIYALERFLCRRASARSASSAPPLSLSAVKKSLETRVITRNSPAITASLAAEP